MKYYHQYDSCGNHRLGTSRYSAKKKDTPIKWGKWVPYTHPATLGQYAAVTEYYDGSVAFPDCKVLYRIQKDVWPLEHVDAQD